MVNVSQFFPAVRSFSEMPKNKYANCYDEDVDSFDIQLMRLVLSTLTNIELLQLLSTAKIQFMRIDSYAGRTRKMPNELHAKLSNASNNIHKCNHANRNVITAFDISDVIPFQFEMNQ